MVNEWTRKDVPGAVQVLASWDTAPGDGYPLLASHTLDAVVEHLNAHHPKPRSVEQFMREVNTPDPEKVALDEARIKANIERNEARRETDRWRRAHEIVEAERDQAREQWKKWEYKADEWKARAVAAEARTVITREDVTRAVRRGHNMLNAEVGVVNEMCDLLGIDAGQAADPVEAAEARTAPAVTKAEVEKKVRKALALYGVAPECVRDAVWSLVSGSDPAVYVVRESDIAAVEVEQDSHGEWFADGEHVYTYGAEDSRNLAGGYMRKAVRRLAVARAIEAEPADPVEELAGQIESATRTAIRQVCDDLTAVAPTLDPLTVERAMEVTAASRKVAAHVLGQGDPTW